MRRKKPEEHVNHERWLVSYADFITLLFAFFVVMFSVSRVDTKQVKNFSESFSMAVGLPLGGVGNGILPGAASPTPVGPGASEPARRRSELQEVESRLRLSTEAGDLEAVAILHIGNELVLRFAEAVTFPSGDITLKDTGIRALHAIADALRDRNVNVRIEGHTDNVPIRNTRFRSNWELSTGRATSVVAELAGPGRMAPERLAAAGYGEFHPIVPNTTPELRAQNRRVDIVISEVFETPLAKPEASAAPAAPAAAPVEP